MTIQLNGNDHTLDAPINVEKLLVSIGLGGKPLVVEHNKKALFPREYPQTLLENGDQIEIITIAAGG